MLGTVNQTIQEVTPTTLNLSTNPQSANLLNGLNSSNISGVSSTPLDTPSSPNTSIAGNLIGGTTPTNNFNASQPSNVNSTEQLNTTPVNSTDGLTTSLLGNNYYKNTAESVGKPEGLVAPNTQSNKILQSQGQSQNSGGFNLNSNFHLPSIGSDSTGLIPMTSDQAYQAGMESLSPYMNTDALMSTVDTSALGGEAASNVGYDALVNASSLPADVGAWTNTDALMGLVDTSGLEGGAAAGSSGLVSGLGGLLQGAGGVLGTAGPGFMAGSLIGGAAGTPVAGGAAGAAGGAATGALVGSFIFPGIGTAAGAVIGGLAGLLGGVLGGQKPSVGPDANTSIQGWDSQTNQPKFVSGADNGGNAAQSSQLATKGWNDVQSIVKNLGGQPTGATGIDVGTFKGNYTVGNPGTGYVDPNNPSEKVSGSETANYFKNPTQAEAEFVAQQLNYIGQNGKATGLNPDQLKQLSQVTYQDVLSGKVPGMQSNASNGQNTTDYFAQGAQQYGTPHLATGGMPDDPHDQGGFVEGPGGPTDDKVDAKLSNTEYVMPSDVVHRLGQGNPHLGAKVLTAIVDLVRGPDADKYDRPKNVDSPHPNMYLGGGLFTATAPSSDEAHQEQLNVGGLAYDNMNISKPTASTSKAMTYATGGMHLNNATQDAAYYQTGGMISSGGAGTWPNNNYQHGGEVLENSDNLHAKRFADGGLIQDNIENDTATQPSLVKRHHNTSQHKAGEWAHGISQWLGTENNKGHDYKKGGLVFDGSKPTRKGIFDQNAYSKGGFVVQGNSALRNNTGTAISPIGPETTYKKGGLVKRPSFPTPSNINYQP